MDLLDAVIDRDADILERIGAEVDQVSHEIFEPDGAGPERSLSYQTMLKTIGRKGDLTSKVRESLVSIGRLLLFLANEAEGMKWSKDMRAQLQSMQRDVRLAVRPRHLSVEQDHLPARCACSAWSTSSRTTSSRSSRSPLWCCMPPTLVASIYGMNFKNMPELDWEYGYPLALVMMLLAAVLPYLFFKWKKWL